MKERPIKKMTTFTILQGVAEKSGRTIALPLAAGFLVIAKGEGEAVYWIEGRTGHRIALGEATARMIFRRHVLDDDARTVVKLLAQEGHIDVCTDTGRPCRKSLQAAWELLDRSLTQYPAPLVFDGVEYVPCIV